MGTTDSQFNLDKILVSSCAIFFILVVTINLIPYFPFIAYNFPTNSSGTLPVPSPSVSDYLPTNFSGSIRVPTAASPLHRDTCVSFLHSIRYKSSANGCQKEGGTCKDKKQYSWDWIQSNRVSESCGFHRVHKSEASVLVNGSWIVVAGDSECRLTYISLLEVFVGSEEMNRVKVDFTYQHGNYFKTVDGIGLKMDFLWRPFVSDLTELMWEFNKTKRYPDLIILGAGIWEMLYVNKAPDYGRKLEALRESYLATLGGGMPVFWLGMPTLVNPKLNTEMKRARLTDGVRRMYDDALGGSRILRQSGGPMFLLDLRLLSDLCGADCAADGMHYEEFVHDAAVQILLNILAISSNKNIQP
ncbi:protein ALTERED XYLOGLUCAN 9-like [Henckelia pumila]|uniref:protein ALTERED XYLOGLUCAN 9-like n=1 Tax=Henckelia pumila TaxID=405737 RepID=UPI003C6E800E